MAKSKFNIGDLIVDSLKLGDGDIKSFLGDSLLYPLAKSIEDAVVTCASATYNGSNQTAQDITVVLSGVTLVENTDYTVTQNTGGTNVGSYNVTVTGIGDYENTASGTFTINKVTPTVVSPVPNVLTYNGSAQELVTAGSTNFGILKYKVGSDSWSTSIPTRTRGGAYTVYYKVVGDSNINDIPEDTVACSINEKPVTAVVTVSPSTYTYNGSYCEPTVTAKDGETVIDPSEYTVTYSNNLNAGTATVTIYDVVGGDYYVEGSTTFTINKADTTYTAPTANDRTYDGTSKALLNAGSVTGGTIYYSSDNSTWGTSIPSGTNATSYTTYWNITGDSNHNDKASASISTTISKASGSVTTAPTAKSLTYNAAAQQLVTAGSGTGTMMYKLDSGSWSTSIPTATNATSYTVYYKASASTNYNESASGSVSVTIAKVTPTVTAPTAKSLTYNGSAQQLANAGSTNWGTMQYSTASSGTYSASIPSGTSAGGYEVWYKVVGNSNVNDVAAAKITVNIAKANPSYTAPTAKSLTYNGSAQALLNAGSTSHGTIQYSSDNSSWSTTIPSQTNANTYTSYWRLVGDGNHNDVSSTSISTTIAKANGSVTINGVSLIYNGTARNLATVSNNTGTMHYSTNGTSWSTSIPTATNANSYTVYWYMDASTNYEGIASANSRYVSSTIAKADQSAPTATGATTTYNTTATATASGGGGQGSIEWSNGNTQTSVGSKTTKARWSGNSNYNASPYSNEVTVQMNKAAGSVTTAPVNTNYTYNGTARAVASAGSGTGTMYYRLGTSGSFSTTMPTMTNAGSDTLYYYAAESTNYTQSSTGSITVSVQRASRTISFTSAPTTVVPGATITVAASPSAGSGDGTITYSSSDTSKATVNGNTITGVADGTVTITATISQGTNYNSATTSYTLTIIKNYFRFIVTAGGTIKWSGSTNSNALSYSKDGVTWTSVNNTKISASVGETILWRGTPTPQSNTGIGSFVSGSTDLRFDVEGNIMSLLYGDNFEGQTSLNGKNYAFFNLMNNNKNVVNAKKLLLPATTLSPYCYCQVFASCSNLITLPPSLPATVMEESCYSATFAGTSITSIPSGYLPSTNLANYCYNGMFQNCTLLTSIPSGLLPATSLAQICYGRMFRGCTSLTTIPSGLLPATNLDGGWRCYQSMFSGCTSLMTVPSNLLPATTLAQECYQEMFRECTSLTTAPVLSATTLASNCYGYMFQNCTSLNYIKAMFTTTPSTSYTNNWVNGVASSGTFVKNSAATWTSSCGVSTYPCNWTVETASS